MVESAYTYRCEIRCPACTVRMLINQHLLPDAAREVSETDAIAEAARRAGVDTTDERLYDSGDFPKPVDSLSLTCILCEEFLPHNECVPERCYGCNEIIS